MFISKQFYILKTLLVYFRCMSVFACMYYAIVCQKYPWRPEEGDGSSGTGVRVSTQHHIGRYWKADWILCKSSKEVYLTLSHLSRTTALSFPLK